MFYNACTFHNLHNQDYMSVLRVPALNSTFIYKKKKKKKKKKQTNNWGLQGYN